MSTSEPRATATRAAPGASAARSTGHHRRAVTAASTPSSTRVRTPIGVATRELPTSGMNGTPVVTPVVSRSGASRVSRPSTETTTPSAVAAPWSGGRAGRRAAGGPDRHGQDDAEHHVEPEDRPPVGDREDRRTQQRPEHAAELLHRADHAERGAAAPRRPQVGHQGERRRHQPAAAHALQHPTRDQHRQLHGAGGDHGADDEHRQGTEQHPLPGHEVGDPADQREHGDVAEQEARDDGGGPLQGLDPQPHPGHHVGQGEHDDVGVSGGEGDRDRGGAEQRPRARGSQPGRRSGRG